MIQTNLDTWLIDSGASRHMTGYRKLLFDLEKKESSQNVILGDDVRYAVRGLVLPLSSSSPERL